jgi:hypothetical protein
MHWRRYDDCAYDRTTCMAVMANYTQLGAITSDYEMISAYA